MLNEYSLKSKKDIFIVVISSILIVFFLIYIDMFELLVEFTAHHEEYEIDEVILFIMTLPITLTWFAYRRIKESDEINKLLNQQVEKEVKIRLQQEKALQIQSKNALLGEMLANIAHQWRQPLSTITTIASGTKLQIEHNSFNKDELPNSLDSIVNNANYLSNTIDTFRDFIKEEKRFEKKDINITILEAIKIVEPSITKNHIEFQNNLDETKKIYISTIHTELKQVLINIINNSIDAIIEKDIKTAQLSLTLNVKKSHIEINIKDNGGGIPNEILDRIYEPYFTTKHESQGTGLGLYMVYDIVSNSLNGKVDIENYKKGVSVTLSLPYS